MKNSKRKIASFCGDIPVELFYAADLEIVKINGDGKPAKKSKSFFPTYMCSYAMNCFDFIMEHDNDFDGYIFVNKCHAMETLYEYTREYISENKAILINLPKCSSAAAIDYYRGELIHLKNTIQQLFGINITCDAMERALKQTIEVHSLKDVLMCCLAQERLTLQPNEMEALNSKAIGQPVEFIKEVNELLTKQVNQTKRCDSHPRIMLSGIIVSPQDIPEVINKYGGKVVAYSHFEQFSSVNDYSGEKEIMHKIASSYLHDGSECSGDFPNPAWIDTFEKKISENRIDGVIFAMIKFCPLQAYGVITLTSLLKQKGIPFLVIDDTFSNACSAQIHTRIQAFLECF